MRRRPRPEDATEPLGREDRDLPYVSGARFRDETGALAVPHPAAGSRRKWIPAGAAVVLVAAVAAAGAVSLNDSSGDAGQGTIPATTPITEVLITEPVVEATVAITDPGTPKTSLKRSLKRGMAGSEVKALQERLFALGFYPGDDPKNPTGSFGPLTRSAVWAFEKLVLNTPSTKATGVVTNEMWQVMQDDILIRPERRNTTATHLEVYLHKQVAVIFEGDKPVFISHISTGELDKNGKPAMFREDEVIDTDDSGNPIDPPVRRPVIGWAKTPIGVFTVHRKIEGVRRSRLGGMLNPVYFNQGIAIHGGRDVPLTPQSHGCVRVPNAISEIMFNLLSKGDKVYVFNGKKRPEDATAQERQMLFNQPDPDATTTTTTTEPPVTNTTRPRQTSTTAKPQPTTTTRPPRSTTTTTRPPRTTTTEPPPSSSSPPGTGG